MNYNGISHDKIYHFHKYSMNRHRPSRVLLRLFDFLTEKRVFQRVVFDCKENIILSHLNFFSGGKVGGQGGKKG